MPQVFISYARVDEPFARQLAAALSDAGADVWLDVEDIPAGMKWSSAIQQGLKSSEFLLVIISPESMASNNVEDEWQYFLDQRKPVVPILLRKADIHFQLSRVQYINFESQPFDQAWKQLHAELRRKGLQLKPLTGVGDTSGQIPAQPALPVLQPTTQSKSLSRRLRIGTFLLALLALIGIGGLLLNQSGGGRTPGVSTVQTAATDQPTTVVALQPTDPPDTATNPPVPTPTETLTMTPSVTLTPPPTLAIALVVGTLDAEATIAQGTLNANNTAAARATEYAGGTQSAVNQTATATQWTATPSPNFTASIEAFRAERAATETEAFVDGQTATAASWTNTPTPTSTPTPTPTATFTFTLTPVPPGFTPVTRNTDWTPVTQEFAGVTMVLVPAGCFEMGSNDGANDEEPVNRQCFDQPFWIDQTEVTQADFERLGGQKADANGVDGDQHPVENITWFESQDFCALRGMRLPTEREWEYATRGPDNLIYPWGNDWNSDNAIGLGNSSGRTAVVGSRPAGISWVGSLDMSGNVWEWTSSLYLPYDSQANREADTRLRTDILRVFRGGSWFTESSGLSTTNRNWASPDYWDHGTGFRCARDYDAP